MLSGNTSVLGIILSPPEGMLTCGTHKGKWLVMLHTDCY